jgi:hypothetical protein
MSIMKSIPNLISYLIKFPRFLFHFIYFRREKLISGFISLEKQTPDGPTCHWLGRRVPRPDWPRGAAPGVALRRAWA